MKMHPPGHITRQALLSHYSLVKEEIANAMAEYREIGRRASNERLFSELVFCLLTPQSSARRCWAAVERINEEGLLMTATKRELAMLLRESGVRFHNRKASNIIASRWIVDYPGGIRGWLGAYRDVKEVRDELVKSMKGMGYKEASHFLRNIGLGEDIAILDRHILRSLVALGSMREAPKALTRLRYFRIEKTFLDTAKDVGLRPEELDLTIWSFYTGEVFK